VSEILIAIALVAALACPVHMLWRMRRHGQRQRVHGSSDPADARRRAIEGELRARGMS
jgi:hypothetical protein